MRALEEKTLSSTTESLPPVRLFVNKVSALADTDEYRCSFDSFGFVPRSTFATDIESETFSVGHDTLEIMVGLSLADQINHFKKVQIPF